jgi:hypothetical protein
MSKMQATDKVSVLLFFQRPGNYRGEILAIQANAIVALSDFERFAVECALFYTSPLNRKACIVVLKAFI